MATLFVSDLHLDPAWPDTLRCFIEVLESPARGAEALYILGDLFEIWIGDDHIDPAFEPLLEALRRLDAAGTPVWLMHGNRDFLIGETFLRRAGCRPLDDPHRVTLYGRDTLLMHGDSLCTDDTEYQHLRARLRDPRWQREVLARPVSERLAMARQARAASDRATRDKPRDIMDVNQDAVREAMRAHGVTRLIHGHTHRPRIHRFGLDGRDAERIVLGDWYREPSLLWLDHDGARFENINPGAPP